MTTTQVCSRLNPRAEHPASVRKKEGPSPTGAPALKDRPEEAEAKAEDVSLQWGQAQSGAESSLVAQAEAELGSGWCHKPCSETRA